MIFNSKLFWNIDLITEVLNFGKSNYPELIPLKENNFLVRSRKLKEAFDQLLPLYLRENNYNIII